MFVCRNTNYAGLPGEILWWERMWKGKNDRREDIPDSIDATLVQIDKGAYVNICTILRILISVPISSASCEKVHLNPPKSEDLFEKYNGPG